MRSKKKKNTRAASKAVFQELAVKNVKKSARDYQVYFMTLTLAVALFYTFNSISAQFGILGIPDTMNYLSFSAGMMMAVSLFICLIMGFLVVYANRFMLKRRKREMGVYMTLGMEQEDINALMWKETSVIGGASLGAGLVLGVLFSQGLSMITAKIVGVGLGNYHFVLSLKAVAAAVFFFGLMFFFVYRLNIREIKKMQLIDLIRADKRNERMSRGKLKDVLVCVLAAVFLAAGYISIASGAGESFGQSLMLGTVLVIAGTILFCLSASGLLVKLCKMNKNYYYRKLHIFVVNQLGSRLKNAGISIGVVSILICLSVSSMALGLGLGKYLISDVEKLAPYDISLRVEEEDTEEELSDATVFETLLQKGIVLSDYVKDAVEFRVYTADGITNLLFEKKKNSERTEDPPEEYELNIIGVDDFNNILKLQGARPVALGSQEYGVNYSEKRAEKQLESYAARAADKPLDLNGNKLSLAEDGIYNYVYYNRNVLSDAGTLIVPQSVAEGLDLSFLAYDGTFKDEGSYDRFIEAFTDSSGTIRFAAKTDIMTESASNNLTVTYIGVYLGITFLIIAGAVIALQQLSQSSDNEGRYALLKKLGTRDEDMKESLEAQLKVYFGLPFILAAVNAAFIIGGAYRNIPDATVRTIFQTSAFAAVLVIVVYGLYYIVTYVGSRRILKIR